MSNDNLNIDHAATVLTFMAAFTGDFGQPVDCARIDYVRNKLGGSLNQGDLDKAILICRNDGLISAIDFESESAFLVNQRGKQMARNAWEIIEQIRRSSSLSI